MAREPIHLRLFDDGSLTDDDEEELRASLDLPKDGVLRAPASPTALQAYPQLLRVREQFVMCRKLFDLPMYCEEPVLILDTDVLFLRPFEGLAEAALKHDFVCMRDQQSAYSPSMLARIGLRLRGDSLISHANAGVLLVNPKRLDLERLNAFFSEPDHLRYPALVEQTAWALLGASANSPAYWRPEAVAFPPQDLFPDDNAIAWHFAADYRHLLSQTKVDKSTQQLPPTTLMTSPAHVISWSEEAARGARILGGKLKRP